MKGLGSWLFDKPNTVIGESYAALDIGTSKIACFIAKADKKDAPSRVIGIGHQVADGVRNGAVTNMDRLQRAISSTVATAEQMAGETIDSVIVNVAGSLLSSHTLSIELPLHGREVTQADLSRIMLQAQNIVPDETGQQALELIHAIPTDYTLDQQKGVRDPVGMTGHMLQAQMHMISASFGAVRTLMTAIAKCHLNVDRLVAAPYASGLSCLVEDEMDLGSLVIDMGAGTTSYAVFFDGHVVYTDGIGLGGAHVTSDIARGLTTSVQHAERLKTLYGNAIPSAMDEREIIDVPQVGEEDELGTANHVPKSHLIRIIQPRIEETIEMVRDRLRRSGFQDIAGRRIVLTGGASQLPGVRELAQRMFDKQVRLGRPLRVARPQQANGRSGSSSFTGLAEATSGSAFATTAGLLAVAMQPELAPSVSLSDSVGSGNFLHKANLWLKQNM